MSISKELLHESVVGKKPHLASYTEITTEFSSELSFCDDPNIGSYRLSTKLLNRIMLSGYRSKDGKKLPGITKTELTILLLLLEIADNTCYVDALHYKELSSVSKSDSTALFSVKSYYNALHGLKEKGFITYDDEWGTRDIRILHNEIGPKEQFLSLNRDSLVPGTAQHDTFYDFPIGAQKIYLYIIAKCHPRFGYTANIEELKDKLGFESKYLVSSYLKMIEALLGPIKRTKSKRGRGKNNNIHLGLVNRLNMAKKEGILPKQLSYFGRTFERLLKKYAIPKNVLYPLPYEYYRSEFLRIINEYIHMGPRNVFKVIEYAVSQQGLLNPQSLTDAEYILVNAN